MTFGEALKRVRTGNRIAREGWNGKGMFVVLIKGSQLKEAFDKNNDTLYQYNDVLALKTADDRIQVGWLASQTDMLATDWEVKRY